MYIYIYLSIYIGKSHHINHLFDVVNGINDKNKSIAEKKQDEKNKIKPVIPVTTKLFDHKVGSINHKNSIEILKYLNDTRG
jgi:CO dehydrogenase nickel-insertion accessory protein CooC1